MEPANEFVRWNNVECSADFEEAITEFLVDCTSNDDDVNPDTKSVLGPVVQSRSDVTDEERAEGTKLSD